jgi:hypothetical protein
MFLNSIAYALAMTCWCLYDVLCVIDPAGGGVWRELRCPFGFGSRVLHGSFFVHVLVLPKSFTFDEVFYGFE